MVTLTLAARTQSGCFGHPMAAVSTSSHPWGYKGTQGALLLQGFLQQKEIHQQVLLLYKIGLKKNNLTYNPIRNLLCGLNCHIP